MSESDPGWNRVTRLCPHCGARAQTLGTVCPKCGKSYQPLGLLDRIPFLSDDFGGLSWYVSGLWGVVTLLLVAGFVYLMIQSWVAATLVLAFLFVALVAAIGISNWFAQR